MNGSLIAACAGVIGAGEVLAFGFGRILGPGRAVRASHALAVGGAVALGLALMAALR